MVPEQNFWELVASSS